MFENIVNEYSTIQLLQVKKIKLLNRFETKFVFTKDLIIELLNKLKDLYFITIDENKFSFNYLSIYFDTADLKIYNDHNKLYKQKIRIRKYDDNKMFLEIKTKSNGKTIKYRMLINTDDLTNYYDWIIDKFLYNINEFNKLLLVTYNRITLINKNLDERITIDYDINYYNYITNKSYNENKFIVELKSKLKKEYNNSQSYSKYVNGINNTL